MVVGICTVELFLPNNGSLKDKRRIVKSIKDRMKQRFNVSVAEIDDQELWQKTVLGIACVSNDKGHINQTLDRVVGMIRTTPMVEVVEYHLEMI
jgi:uncharacterized protein YlxP (DUF503 family)